MAGRVKTHGGTKKLTVSYGVSSVVSIVYPGEREGERKVRVKTLC